MRKVGVIVLLSSLALGCAARQPAAGQPSPAPAAGEELPELKLELPPREELPLEAREMLMTRMLRHGKQMTALMVSVMLLEYEATQVLAQDIAEEPRLGRPAAGEKGTLNALLPPSFFKYQDDLVERARALGAAAKARDDRALVDAFAGVTKSCVGCHSVYLYESLDIPEHEEPPDTPSCDPGDSCGAGAGDVVSRPVRWIPFGSRAPRTAVVGL